jgi:Zn-dependent membrane protease YugP
MYEGYGLYLLFSLPALLLGLWAQFKVKGAFNRFSKIRSYIGLTGAEIAERMLRSSGVNNVQIVETRGVLTDHYDPGAKKLRLSQGVFRSNSIAAAGIAAHEAGHALQHNEGYTPLKFRTAMVPTVQLGSWLGPIVFIAGLVLKWNNLAWFGLGLFALTAVFALATLPVEFNASRRAKAWLTNSGVIVGEETTGINKVLDAAALTYVAGAVQAITTLLYYAFLLMGRSRD